MNRKPGLALAFFLFFITNSALSQDSLSQLQRSWNDLQAQHVKRVDLAILMGTEFLKINPNDSVLVQTIGSQGTLLKFTLAGFPFPDSMSIIKLKEINASIRSSFRQLFNGFEEAIKSKDSQKLLNLQAQFEACENKLHLAKRIYNELCDKYQRRDIYFD